MESVSLDLFPSGIDFLTMTLLLHLSSTFTEDTHPSHNHPCHGLGNSASQPHFAWMEDPNFVKSFRQMDSTHESTEGYSRQYKKWQNTPRSDGISPTQNYKVGTQVQIRTPAQDAGHCKAQSRSQTLPHGHTTTSSPGFDRTLEQQASHIKVHALPQSTPPTNHFGLKGGRVVYT